MSGLFGGGKKKPATDPKVTEAQARQEERATAAETSEMQGVQRRRRRMRTGGLRLLFSPARLEGPGSEAARQTKLGAGD
jgi:hypothetical protein|tara:strand:+ start:3069 stop:3305 length:237 start_codon:yes stop_codon:yes gene_type:complete